MNAEILTMHGKFTQDHSGLWHFRRNHDSITTPPETVLPELLREMPEGPVWLWWNNRPCPVKRTDTHKDLFKRWREIENRASNGTNLLDAILENA